MCICGVQGVLGRASRGVSGVMQGVFGGLRGDGQGYLVDMRRLSGGVSGDYPRIIQRLSTGISGVSCAGIQMIPGAIQRVFGGYLGRIWGYPRAIWVDLGSTVGIQGATG